MAIQRLTAAYRSRSRPSSTPGAKASTVNSYYLDGERLTHSKVCESNSLNTLRIHVAWILITELTDVSSVYWPLCSFQGPPRRNSGVSGGGLSKLSSGPTSKLMGKPGRRSREISLERR